jgi:predicted phage-related endonuclease
MRKLHDHIQGTAEWHSERHELRGASEAAAMLDISPKTSRNELLKLKATGIKKEVNAYTQRIFDNGHRVEALARPIIENLIDDILYPVTLSLGKLSASCDGLTGDGDIAFEHKQWNAKLAESVRNSILPEEHWPQCQQVLMVSGAKRLIFVCSDGTKNNLEYLWIYPDESWFATINAGWAQFEKDLEAYKSNIIELVNEPPKAAAIADLPMVTVQVKGELTTCNLKSVKPYFDKFLDEAKIELVTDDDFAQAEAEAKLGRETAKRCKLTAKAVVDQMLSISEVTRELEAYAMKFDALALRQEKAVKEQKEQRKATARAQREQAYKAHMTALQNEIWPVALVVCQKPDFVGAMKNQRMLESLYNKLDTELAHAKIQADAVAQKVRLNLALIKDYPDYNFLFNDIQTLAYKEFDELKILVESRIEAHQQAEKARIEQERERIRMEIEARLRAEQELKAKPELEEEAKASLKLRLEQERPTRAEEAEDGRFEIIRIDTYPTVRYGDLSTRDRIIAAVAREFLITADEAEALIKTEFWNSQ